MSESRKKEDYSEMFLHNYISTDKKHKGPHNGFLCDAKEDRTWTAFCSEYHNFDIYVPDEKDKSYMPRMMEVLYLDEDHARACMFVPNQIYMGMWQARRNEYHWLEDFDDVRVTDSIREFSSIINCWRNGLDDRDLAIYAAMKICQKYGEVHADDMFFYEFHPELDANVLTLLSKSKEGKKNGSWIEPYTKKDNEMME